MASVGVASEDKGEWMGTSVYDLLLIAVLRGGLAALMAVGLTLVLGVMRMSNFAHGELYMIGAFAGYFVYTGLHVHPLLAIFGGAAVGFLAGIVIERTVFASVRRTSRDKWLTNSFLVTVGLSFVLQYGALATIGPKYRGVPKYFDGAIRLSSSLNIPLDRMVALALAIVCITGLWLFLTRTRVGTAIRSISEDETGARLIGIDVARLHTLTFALSAMLAAVAGASLLSIAPAEPFVGVGPLNRAYFVVILAGFGNVMGSVIGGFAIGLVETLAYYSLGAGWQDVLSLVILILILLVKPAGIFGTQLRGV